MAKTIKHIKCKLANKTLGDMPIGSIVKIPENGIATNYIVVHKGKPSDLYDDSCNGVWLLREQAHSKRGWDGTDFFGSLNSYGGSDIETWLDDDFLNTIDHKIRGTIKTVKIPYRSGFGTSKVVQSGASGSECKAFLLSGYEVGFTQSDSEHLPIEGAKLAYFSGNISRVCKDSTYATVNWWLRSPNTESGWTVFYADTNGSLSCHSPYRASAAVRPAFVLPSSLLVGDDGTIVGTSTSPSAEAITQASKQLKDIPRGETFIHCGYEWLVLEHRENNSTLVLSKNIIEKMPFDKDNSNNWEKSSLREYLNRAFPTRMCGRKSPSELGFMSFATDLTADDGLKDYGQSIDTVSLLTCDLYRQHRDTIKPITEWWWLVTPCSTLAANSCSVRVVYSDGTLYSGDAYYEDGGVRPVCCLSSDILV